VRVTAPNDEPPSRPAPKSIRSEEDKVELHKKLTMCCQYVAS